MDSRLESTEMGTVARTHFFTWERWQLEHKEPTALLVISPTEGPGRPGRKRGHDGSLHWGCSRKSTQIWWLQHNRALLVTNMGKISGEVGVLWQIQQKQTGYCNTHLVTPTSREDPDHSRAHDLLATGREELQMEISEMTTSSTLSKDRRV